MKRKDNLRLLVIAPCVFFILLIQTGCDKGHLPDWGGGHTIHGSRGLSMLLLWNNAATVAVSRAGAGPNGPVPPMPESRIYAMVNVAMHDALNSIEPKYKTYALQNTIDRNADVDAAIAQAAHDVIAALLPPEAGYADSLLQASLYSIANSNAKTDGINLGKNAGAATLSKRANDGVANAQIPYVPGTGPGQYVATPPFDGPPFNGFVAVPGWGNIIPFGLTAGSQFRVPPPYAINSANYTADYNASKNLGAAVNSTRTADQTQIGLFWLENSPLGWNRIAVKLIIERNIDALSAARLLGVMHMALADANIGSLDSKFYYKYWRPVTAVRMGDTDGNPNTAGLASWDVLAPPTPPIPDYPSNHATNGGAAAEVLKQFFGDNTSFSQTSTSLPGITRSYKSFSQAATENSLSRIFAGYHFPNAVTSGQEMGVNIGRWDYYHTLPLN